MIITQTSCEGTGRLYNQYAAGPRRSCIAARTFTRMDLTIVMNDSFGVPHGLSPEASDAYEDARMQGLCHEGALEIALRIEQPEQRTIDTETPPTTHAISETPAAGT